MTDIGNSTACSNVGRYCFGGCWNLEHLVFDEGTENTLYIHPNDWYTGSIRTFVNCKLKSLYLGRNVSCTVLNSNGYYNPFYKQTELTEIQFGKDFNDIFSGMFEGCSSLKHIEIPDNVTTIGDYAFLDCTSLSELLLHEGLKNIGRNSFKNCKQIETLNFPSTLERINSEAFTNCTGINSVYCNSEVPCSMEENAFPGLVYLNATLYIPEGSKDLYLNANGWKDFANIVEKDVNGNDVESQQCEKPTISFINGEVVFSCETEGVEYVYKCMPPNSATSTTNDKFKPSSQYIITVYAKKAGYLDSEPTTAEIDIKGVKGDVNQDGEVTIADAVSVVNIILANNAATAPALQKPQENEEPK